MSEAITPFEPERRWSERERAARQGLELRAQTAEKLRATGVEVRITQTIAEPLHFDVFCFIEGRPFTFTWQPERWKAMPTSYDWDALLLEARPIRT